MSNQKHDYSVMIDYARTPFAKAGGRAPGKLADVDPLDLQIPLINTLLERSGVNVDDIAEVITGNVHQEGPQGLNIGRLVVLHADCKLPDSVGGTTLDRFCASGIQGIAFADGLIARNPESVYVVTGVQSMSMIPMGGLNVLPHPKLNRDAQIAEGLLTNHLDMSSTAENLAKIYDIPREAQDAFAVRSHQLHSKAVADGRFDAEIVPVKGVSCDDGVRPDSNINALSRLPTIARSKEKGGSITAGNASQITDGATATLMSSESYARANNLPVLARVIAVGQSGCAPEIMGIGPVDASKDALKKASRVLGKDVTLSDMGRIELNEAFAAQALAVVKEWDNQGMKPDMDKINVNGGAIAMGHPLGATGIRLAGTLALELKKANQRFGMATLCVGGGQGMALIIENPDYQP